MKSILAPRSKPASRGLHRINLIAITLLLAMAFVAPARAMTPRADGDRALPLTAGSTDLRGADLTGLTRADWRALNRGLVRTIERGTDETWTTAAVNAIFLARYHRKQARLSGVPSVLMQRYLHESNETNRVLALAAMRAIGHRPTMERLAHYARFEQSARVRALTIAALMDFYGQTVARASQGPNETPLTSVAAIW